MAKTTKNEEKAALSLRLPIPLYKKVHLMATKEKRSINSQIEVLLEKAFGIGFNE